MLSEKPHYKYHIRSHYTIVAKSIVFTTHTFIRFDEKMEKNEAQSQRTFTIVQGNLESRLCIFHSSLVLYVFTKTWWFFLFSREMEMPTHSFNINGTDHIIEKQISRILQSSSRHCESSESSGLGVDRDISAQRGFYRVNTRWTNAQFP